MTLAFTLVELVIVIAVIAILSGVTVSAYFGIIKNANESNITSLIKEVNDLSLAFKASNEENSSNDYVFKLLSYLEENGIDFTDCAFNDGSIAIAFDSKDKEFKKLDLTKEEVASNIYLFANDSNISKIISKKASIVLSNDLTSTISKPIELNYAANIYDGNINGSSISYFGDSEAHDVFFYGNKNTNILFDASKWSLYTFGELNEANVKNVAPNSFHVYSNIKELKIDSGRIVFESSITVSNFSFSSNVIISSSDEGKLKVTGNICINNKQLTDEEKGKVEEKISNTNTEFSVKSEDGNKIEIVEKEEIKENEEINDPICYIKETGKKYISLNDAITEANENSGSDSIYINVGKNASIDKDITLCSEDILYFPYEGETIHSYGKICETDYVSSHSPVSSLTLNANLNVSGTIEVGAITNGEHQGKQGYISGSYSKITINSGYNLNIKNSGIIKCHGVIDGNGEINIEDGGTVFTNFAIDDYGGGSNSAQKYGNNESPFLMYKLPYLRAKTTIKHGGYLRAYCVLWTGTNQTHNPTEQTIIGKGGLIELSDGYIIHSQISNSEENYKEKIEIFGNATNNAMAINIEYGNGTLEVKTDNVYFPVSKYLDIDIYSGTFTLKNKVKVLPGSTINFYNNSIANLDGNIILYSSFKDKGEFKSEFGNLSGRNYYPDYGTHKSAIISFLNQSTLEISNSLNDDIGLAGNIEISTNTTVLESLLLRNKFQCELKSSESLGEKVAYTQSENLNIYVNNEQKYRCLNNYYFSFTDSNSDKEIVMYNNSNEEIAYKKNNKWNLIIDLKAIEVSISTNYPEDKMEIGDKIYLYDSVNQKFVDDSKKENEFNISFTYDGKTFYVKADSSRNNTYINKNEETFIEAKNGDIFKVEESLWDGLLVFCGYDDCFDAIYYLYFENFWINVGYGYENYYWDNFAWNPVSKASYIFYGGHLVEVKIDEYTDDDCNATIATSVNDDVIYSYNFSNSSWEIYGN